jgi:hypothetical protein
MVVVLYNFSSVFEKKAFIVSIPLTEHISGCLKCFSSSSMEPDSYQIGA